MSINLKNSNSVTQVVYATALRWNDERFEYWVQRAEEEFAWNMERAQSLVGGLGQSRALIIGGSGRHAIAAVRRGFMDVTFVDLTQENVNRVERLVHEAGIKNLKTICGDFLTVDMDDYTADLVVMNGVLQHFYEPNFALQKAASLTSKEGVIYFDCYSTGSLYFLIIEWLRHFYQANEFNHVMTVVDRLGLDTIDLSFTSATMTERLADDLFVPQMSFYIEEDMAQAVLKSGFKILHRDYSPTINHNLPRYDSFQFLIKRTIESDISKLLFSPKSNFCLDYSHYQYVQQSIDLMKKLMPKIHNSSDVRDSILVELLLRYHRWSAMKFEASRCHSELRAYLSSCLSR